MNLISPGVYIRELDFSDYVRQIATTTLGLVGVAKKGPMHIPTLVTNEAELIDIFGEPPDTSAGVNEKQRITFTPTGTVSGSFKLRYAGQETAAINIPATTSAVQTALQALTNIGTGNVTVSGDSISTAGGTINVTFISGLANRDVELIEVSVNPTNATSSSFVVVNGSTPPGDFAMLAALFFLRQGNQLYFTRTCQVSSTGDWLASIAESRAATLPGAILWDDVSVTKAALIAQTRSAGEWGNSISLRFTKIAGSQNEKQSLVFSDQDSARNGETFKLTIATASGDVTFSNTPATMRTNLQTAINAITEVDTCTVTGSGTVADPYVVEFNGTTSYTNFATMTRSAPGAGTPYAGTITIGVVQEGVAPTDDVYRMEILGVVDVSGTIGVIDAFDRVMLANDEPTLANNSAYSLLAAVNDGIRNVRSASAHVKFSSASFPANKNDIRTPIVGGTPGDGTSATFSLYGGFAGLNTAQSGVASEFTAAYVGTESSIADASVGFGGGPTAMQVYANPDSINVNVLAVPGVTDSGVLTALVAMCERRADCFCVLDTPRGLTYQQAIAWHNRTGDYASTGYKPNSSFAALYWCWAEVYDPYNRKNVFVPPSVLVPARLAFTDSVAYPWFAPAGFQRGRLPDVLRMESAAPSRGALDAMYGGGNCINPIIDFTENGATIWGQRTTQRRATALDRVNVRRMLITAEKSIAGAVKYIVFEPNDKATWNQFSALVSPTLQNIQDTRGLYGFKVICDESVNTAAVIEQNQMRGVLLLQPTKTAEAIQIDFTLLSTGARFAIPAGAV